MNQTTRRELDTMHAYLMKQSGRLETLKHNEANEDARSHLEDAEDYVERAMQAIKDAMAVKR